VDRLLLTRDVLERPPHRLDEQISVTLVGEHLRLVLGEQGLVLGEQGLGVSSRNLG
jgi:hypothetical protein